MEQVTCSVDDAATAIGVCKSTVYKHIRAGSIESVRLGNRRLVRIDSVRKLVEAA